MLTTLLSTVHPGQTVSINTLVALLGIVVTVGIALILATVWIAYRMGKLERGLTDIRTKQAENDVAVRAQIQLSVSAVQNQVADLRDRLETQEQRIWQERQKSP